MRRVMRTTDGHSWEGSVFVKNCLTESLLVFILGKVKKILTFLTKYVKIGLLVLYEKHFSLCTMYHIIKQEYLLR